MCDITLTPQDQSEFKRLDKLVAKGMSTFLEVGRGTMNESTPLSGSRGAMKTK